MRELGLVAENPDNPGTLRAVPPTAAAAAVLAPLQRQIRETREKEYAVESALNSFESVYAEHRSQRGELFTEHHGSRNIGNALEEALSRCRTELITAQPGGRRSPETLAAALERDGALLARGVRQRTLYQHAVRAHPPTLAYVEQVLGLGAEVRTVPEVFERLIVCDRDVAFVPVGEDRGRAALEIRHPAVVRILVRAFEQVWAQATPFDPATTARPDIVLSEVQLTIVRAIVDGQTDETIARRLGVSRRTVGDHVRRISEGLGSHSRAQLGYLLATSGLVTPDPAEEDGAPS
ncbi:MULTISPECIES: LuxR C-terminal-related transcriptional regulator [unclassified Streptomyces]|uniref:LuxR C-terminal-related transcriptional regulator n=1 Tax=unclassified Streptomyces TaxID=2593676 RepID=UPI0035DA539A